MDKLLLGLENKENYTKVDRMSIGKYSLIRYTNLEKI